MTRNRDREVNDRQFLIVLGIMTFLVWTYLLVFHVRLETREEMRREFLLDSSGAPVEVYRDTYREATQAGREVRGRVWELGKGYREPTQEEKTFEGERP